MKKIFPVALLPLMAAIILSCSQEEPQAGHHVEKPNLKMASSAGTLGNTIGTTHNLILDELLVHPLPVITSPAEMDNMVTARMQQHGFSVYGCGNGSPAGLASSIMQDPISFYKNWLPSSTLSDTAGTLLSRFLLNFQTAHATDMQLALVRTAVSDTHSGPGLTSGDRDMLLTILSITEASLLYTKERKDKDWETSVGNIVAAARGAQHGPSCALRLSLTGGMIQHYKNTTE